MTIDEKINHSYSYWPSTPTSVHGAMGSDSLSTKLLVATKINTARLGRKEERATDTKGGA